jgi:hypothetical protein
MSIPAFAWKRRPSTRGGEAAVCRRPLYTETVSYESRRLSCLHDTEMRLRIVELRLKS